MVVYYSIYRNIILTFIMLYEIRFYLIICPARKWWSDEPETEAEAAPPASACEQLCTHTGPCIHICVYRYIHMCMLCVYTLYIYIYIYIYTHTHIIHTYTYTHAYTYTYTYTHSHIHTYRCARTYMRACMRAYILACIHACMFIHVHVVGYVSSSKERQQV